MHFSFHLNNLLDIYIKYQSIPCGCWCGQITTIYQVKKKNYLPQHFLYFIPLPQGQLSFLPVLTLCTGVD